MTEETTRAEAVFNKRLDELTDQAIRESLTEIQAEFDKRFASSEPVTVGVVKEMIPKHQKHLYTDGYFHARTSGFNALSPTPQPEAQASGFAEGVEAAAKKCIEQSEIIGAQRGSSIDNALWTAAAAIRALKPVEGAPAVSDGVGWLIEHGSHESPMYWTGKWGQWSGDHREAVRFARRQDAFKVGLSLGDMPNDPPHKAVEHRWGQ